jgi:hypothetical protein
MIQDTIIPNRVDAEATDQYSIDVDSDNKLKIKDSYEAAQIINPTAENAIEIIELQANASITPIDHDTLISDTFSDATGYNDSVQTGTTTAIFSVNKYAGNYGEVSDSTDTINNTGANGTGKSGVKITSVAATKLISVTKDGSLDCTKCYLYAANMSTLIETVSFSGNVATFSTNTLTIGQDYWILCDKEGAGYDDRYKGSVTYPKTRTNVTFKQFKNNAALDNITNQVLAINSIVTASGTASTQIVDCSLGTITGDVIATELVCNCPDREAGDDVLYKLKNATQSDDSLELNTKNTVVNLTTVPTGIEIQLVPKASSPTDGVPSVKSYCLKLWKA